MKFLIANMIMPSAITLTIICLAYNMWWGAILSAFVFVVGLLLLFKNYDTMEEIYEEE